MWDLGELRQDLRQLIVPQGSYYGVEAEFGIAAEAALTVEDLVDRRTRLGLVDDFRAPATRALTELAGNRVSLPQMVQ